MASSDLGQSLGWEDEGKVQESEIVLLEPGIYDYTVTKFERGRFDGSDKMAACPMAKLTLHCKGDRMESDVFVNLALNSKVLFRITQFFKSCGLLPLDAKQGDGMPMSLFNHVMGRTGKVKIKNRTYNGREYNEVDEWLKPEPQATTTSWGGSGF